MQRAEQRRPAVAVAESIGPHRYRSHEAGSVHVVRARANDAVGVLGEHQTVLVARAQHLGAPVAPVFGGPFRNGVTVVWARHAPAARVRRDGRQLNVHVEVHVHAGVVEPFNQADRREFTSVDTRPQVVRGVGTHGHAGRARIAQVGLGCGQQRPPKALTEMGRVDGEKPDEPFGPGAHRGDDARGRVTPHDGGLVGSSERSTELVGGRGIQQGTIGERRDRVNGTGSQGFKFHGLNLGPIGNQTFATQSGQALVQIRRYRTMSTNNVEETIAVSGIEATLREDIARDQQRADLPKRGIVTAQAIVRRRHQIAFVVGIVTCGLVFATLVSENIIDLGAKSWIDTEVTRFALAALSVFVILYAFDKERILRRVVREREQLFALDGELAGTLLSSGLVLDAVAAMHARLELADLLPCIVDQGRYLVGGERGVLFLEDDRQPMQPVVDAHSMAAEVQTMVDLVNDRRTVVSQGREASAAEHALDIGVPIRADGELLAVLVLPAIVAPVLTTDMNLLLTRFGDAAGAALLNARRYEAAMFLLDVAH